MYSIVSHACSSVHPDKSQFVLVLLSFMDVFILNRYEAQNGTADEVKEC